MWRTEKLKAACLRARLTLAVEQNQSHMSRDREGAEAEPGFHTDSYARGS